MIRAKPAPGTESARLPSILYPPPMSHLRSLSRLREDKKVRGDAAAAAATRSNSGDDASAAAVIPAPREALVKRYNMTMAVATVVAMATAVAKMSALESRTVPP